MLYRINRATRIASSIEPARFADLDIWERRDLQTWVIQQPAILGEPLLVITSEFDQFDSSRDRLDILAIDQNSKLVVVELKRDRVAGYADLQALRYAAMVASMTPKEVAEAYAKFHKSTIDEARDAVAAFLDHPFDETTFDDQPRIILASENFGHELTTTVLWLTQKFSLDITCVRLIPYNAGDDVFLSPQIIIPIPEAKDYQVRLQRKEADAVVAGKKRQRRMETIRYLLKHGLLKPGDRLVLNRSLPDYLRDREPGPWCRGTVTDRQSNREFMRWDEDGKTYAVSTLTWNIFRDTHPAHEHPGAINGNVHWELEGTGQSLWELAEQHRVQSSTEPTDE